MAAIKNIKPISYIKANAAKVLDHVCESHAPYVVTQNGEARGVILDVDTYQKMQDGLKLFKLRRVKARLPVVGSFDKRTCLILWSAN